MRIYQRRSAVSALPILGLLFTSLAFSGCSADSPSQDTTQADANGGEAAIAEALAVADEYAHAYYQEFPEEAYEVGYPDLPNERLGDHSAAASEAWRQREDAWLARLQALNAADLEGTEAQVPYAFTRERLEALKAMRVCRIGLWNVSPTWTGWLSMLQSTFAVQPVGSPEARQDALARASDVSRYLDTEVENLKEGLRQGYTAAQSNVDAVVAQMDSLLKAPVEDSPFFAPASRDEDEAFGKALAALVKDEIRPAIARYRDFLENEYREGARAIVGVSANPQGEDCYQASIRFYTSLDRTPQEIHDMGLEQLASIQKEMSEIGARSFDTDDRKALIELARNDRRFTFDSREAALAYTQDAIDRAKAAAPDWFGFVPKAEVVIRPYPDYQERTGGGFYSAGAVDGSRPGTYEIGLHDPAKLSKVGLEATTFHETYPGHHLQVSIGLERSGVHPILRYFFFSGTGEGWALYTERLADEMGLYSSDAARLGMLSNEAVRAARLVVDTGMHALGWTRQQALDFLLENTAWAETEAAYEVDRYVAVPAQALSYLIGSLEIQRLRREAEERLGDRFDIKEFHDRVIEDGTVTLNMLSDKIEAWEG